MKLLSVVLLILFAFSSCKKENDIRETFMGNLPIESAKTPKTVSAGQDIVSGVRCVLPSMSGSVYFKGFEIKEYPPLHFTIRAKALYKDWNKFLTSPVMFYLDTTMTLKTSVPGIYILNFYNDKALQQADTVAVE